MTGLYDVDMDCGTEDMNWTKVVFSVWAASCNWSQDGPAERCMLMVANKTGKDGELERSR